MAIIQQGKNKKYYIKYFTYLYKQPSCSWHEMMVKPVWSWASVSPFLTTTASCPLSRDPSHLLNNRTRNTQRKGNHDDVVPDHHFSKTPAPWTDLPETGRCVWGAGKEQLITWGGGPGIPPPQPQTTLHTVCGGERLDLQPPVKETCETKRKRTTARKNQDTHVVSYRIPFWACFVMIRSVFLVQN